MTLFVTYEETRRGKMAKTNWKHVTITLIVFVITAALVGVVISRRGNDSGTPSGSSPGVHQAQAGTIQVPDGPKIKVVNNLPPELELRWDKLGMAADGFQIQLIGTVQNVSNQTVKFSEIGFLFDGRQVAFVQGRTLNPGETMKILEGFPGYAESTKVLEIKVKGFEIIGGSTTAPTAPMPRSTPNPTIETPGKVGITFLELITQGKYSEAEKLLSPKMLKLVKENGWNAELSKMELSKIKAVEKGKPLGLKVVEEYIKGDRADDINIQNENDENIVTFESVLIDGKWKIDEWY